MKEKIIIMPLTEFRQNITSLWKKINKENLTFLITVKGKPVLKITRYEDIYIDLKNDIKNDIKNENNTVNKKKFLDKNNSKIDKKNNNKKWGGYKSVIGEIDWDKLL